MFKLDPLGKLRTAESAAQKHPIMSQHIAQFKLRKKKSILTVPEVLDRPKVES